MDKINYLRSAIRSVLGGEAILFLGAGAAKDVGLPTGQELADLLANECGLSPGYALDAIAEHFIDEYSETKLINTLRKYLKISDVGKTLSLLGSRV